MLKPVTVWDCEVEAVNVKCFVVQHHTFDFYVFPYALDHHDYLRLTLPAAEGIDVDAARSFVTVVAGTIKLNKPYAPMCEEMLAGAFREEVSPGEFAGMVDVYARAYVAAMKSVYAAARYKHLSETMTDPRLPESVLAGVRGVLMLCDRAVQEAKAEKAEKVAQGTKEKERKGSPITCVSGSSLFSRLWGRLLVCRSALISFFLPS